MKQPTFSKDGKKLIYCPACGRCIKNHIVHLGEKNVRKVKCTNCKAKFDYYPPDIVEIDGKKVALFGPGKSTSTTVLTKEDIKGKLEEVVD